MASPQEQHEIKSVQKVACHCITCHIDVKAFQKKTLKNMARITSV